METVSRLEEPSSPGLFQLVCTVSGSTTQAFSSILTRTGLHWAVTVLFSGAKLPSAYYPDPTFCKAQLHFSCLKVSQTTPAYVGYFLL